MPEPSYTVASGGDLLRFRLSGDWSIDQTVPDLDPASFPEQQYFGLALVDAGIETWDSLLMVFVMQCHHYCREHGLSLDVGAMPEAVGRLLGLATTVEMEDEAAQALAAPPTPAWRRRLAGLLPWWPNLRELLEFLGGLARALARLLRGRAMLRGKDLMYFIGQVGPRGLGIITLTSVLVGMILAYLGSVQLREFGAEIYVADLVAIGMTREMGALMTAVILAGRTGAAYAAQIGTMQVNDEVTALKTLGLSGMEFLVLPRLLALLLIMPLLCIYADVLGMVGGAIIATTLDVNWSQYVNQTRGAIGLADFFTGLIKSVFFALIIGIAGCRAGLQCGRNANAVGLATTAAVVTALVYLIVVDALFNILYNNLGV